MFPTDVVVFFLGKILKMLARFLFWINIVSMIEFKSINKYAKYDFFFFIFSSIIFRLVHVLVGLTRFQLKRKLLTLKLNRFERLPVDGDTEWFKVFIFGERAMTFTSLMSSHSKPKNILHSCHILAKKCIENCFDILSVAVACIIIFFLRCSILWTKFSIAFHCIVIALRKRFK